MGNILVRFFYPFTAFGKDRNRQYEVHKADTLPNKKTDVKVSNNDFSKTGSDVDELKIAVAEYRKVQELLTEITEKQFEKAYQQALVLIASGIYNTCIYKSGFHGTCFI